jgi:hypothetical protein
MRRCLVLVIVDSSAFPLTLFCKILS